MVLVYTCERRCGPGSRRMAVARPATPMRTGNTDHGIHGLREVTRVARSVGRCGGKRVRALKEEDRKLKRRCLRMDELRVLYLIPPMHQILYSSYCRSIAPMLFQDLLHHLALNKLQQSL